MCYPKLIASRQSLLAVLALLLCVLPLSAQVEQAPSVITLLDADSGLPIPFAHFACGTHQGISNEQGECICPSANCQDFQLSHLSYGQWVLTAEECSQMRNAQVLHWQRQPGIILQPVTVLALHQGNRPQSKYRFDDQDWLAHDAGDVLTKSPGIAVIRKAGQYGFDPVVRGFKYDQLNLVIDGAQSCVAACPNRMDPPASQVSLNQMEKVEVIKGPHALRYGSGLGGTLLFSSIRPIFPDTAQFHGRVSSGYESNGQLIRGEALAGIRGPVLALDLNGSWSQGDDYTDGDDQPVASGFNRGSFGANAQIRVNESHAIQINTTRNSARDVEFASLGMDLRRDDTWMTNLRHDWTGKGNGFHRLSTIVSGSFVDHLMDNLLKPLNPRMMNMSTAAKTNTYGARTEATVHLGSRLLYAGIDFRHEEASGDRTREFLMGPMMGKIVIDPVWQDSRITNAGIFAEYHWDMNRMQMIAAGRLGFNQADVNQAAASFLEQYPDPDSRQINPAISLGAIRPWSGGWTTSLWIARSQRSPGLIERFIHFLPVGLDPYELLGNPDLKPEVNHQADLNLQKEFRSGRIQFSVFGSYLTDYISGQKRPDLTPKIASAPGVRQFVNLSEAVMAGGELSWTQAWPASLGSEIQVAYVFGEDLDRDQPLAEIPPLDARISVFGQYWQNRITPRISWRQVCRQGRVSSEFGEQETEGFGLLDLQVGVQVIRLLRISAGVQNLLDVSYSEHLSRAVSGSMPPTRLLAPGRSWFVTATVDLGK